MTNNLRPVSLSALSVCALAVLATSACGGSGSDARADSAAVPSSSAGTAAAASAQDRSSSSGTSASGKDANGPEACSLLTVADLKAATGATYRPGTPTDYDNTCRFDTSSDRVTVSISKSGGLKAAKPIGKEVVEVAGLPGATRVDAVVYVERDGFWLSVGTGLPGFHASDRDSRAAETLATLAASRL